MSPEGFSGDYDEHGGTMPVVGYAPGKEAIAVKKWPATKLDIVNAARATSAPKERIDALARLPKDSYSDAAALMADLSKI